MSFDNYLRGKGLRKTTIETYVRAVNNYLEWSEDKRESDYDKLMEYIGERRSEGDKKRTLQARLTAIGHHYDYLKINNPVREIKLIGKNRININHPLNEEELKAVLDNYYGNKIERIILGLLIFQGLKSNEIKSLEKSDLLLTEGRINIRETHCSNTRKLELYPEQIMPLYLHAQGKKNELFPEITGGDFTRITRRIKKINPKIKGLRHIRSSILTNWTERHGLRKTQYMAGHKYLGSTQAYARDGLDGLQKLIDELHPLD